MLTDEFFSIFLKLKKKCYFAYIHYMGAHMPYDSSKYIPGFIEDLFKHDFIGDSLDYKEIRELAYKDKLSDKDKAHLLALYDAEIRFIDENIKEITSLLKENNLLEKTVIIITSDYGEEFWEHNNYGHGHSLYQELLHVPLIISGGKIEPNEILSRVGLIDILPIIIDLADLKFKNLHQQGTSLLRNWKQEILPSPIFAMGTLYGDEK